MFTLFVCLCQPEGTCSHPWCVSEGAPGHLGALKSGEGVDSTLLHPVARNHPLVLQRTLVLIDLKIGYAFWKGESTILLLIVRPPDLIISDRAVVEASWPAGDEHTPTTINAAITQARDKASRPVLNATMVPRMAVGLQSK